MPTTCLAIAATWICAALTTLERLEWLPIRAGCQTSDMSGPPGDGVRGDSAEPLSEAVAIVGQAAIMLGLQRAADIARDMARRGANGGEVATYLQEMVDAYRAVAGPTGSDTRRD